MEDVVDGDWESMVEGKVEKNDGKKRIGEKKVKVICVEKRLGVFVKKDIARF